MIEGLKPYAEYKESGLPWLGVFPSHWVIKRGKSYLFCIDERSKAGKEELLTVSSARGVVPRSSAKVTMFKAESYAGHKLCWPGDLVINSLWAWGGGLGVAQHHGIISTAYSVYRSRPSAQINPRYLHELVRSSAFHWELQVRSKGVWISRLQLTDTSFLDAPIPLPPPSEQLAIVRFLDHANRKIDGFIRAKRKLIGLLNEQKQAIIHRAVTRGLDPNAKLKPSGIPWLGEIPVHWDVPRVKQCAYKISKGTTPSTEGRSILEVGPVRFLKSENISAGRITDKPLCFIDDETNRVIGRSQLAENDVLFVIAGAALGKTAVVSDKVLPANTNQAVAFIRPNSRVVPNFLELWLQSPRIKELIWLNAVQSAQPNLSMADLGNFVAPVPPRDEQQRILDFVKDSTHPMSDAIARTEREIALMQEYRTRLTADIVTGKLDVREAAGSVSHFKRDRDSNSAR